MIQSENEMEREYSLLLLNFATRLLVSDSERESILQSAMENFCDFAKTPKVSIFTRNVITNELCLEAALVNQKRAEIKYCVMYDEFMKNIILSKKPSYTPLDESLTFPMPSQESGSLEKVCFNLPLVASDNKVVGLAAMEHPSGFSLGNCRQLECLVLATFTAIALENNRLFQLAVMDELTGLYLRRFFEIRMQEELARISRDGGELSVLYLDIDDFKKINDTFGHDQGDRVLIDLAKIMNRNAKRGVDVVCRYGGEEFTILLPGTCEENATVVAERMRKDCASHIFLKDSHPVHITISIGVAQACKGDLPTMDKLLKKADKMLYKAKRGGKNRVCSWEKDKEEE